MFPRFPVTGVVYFVRAEESQRVKIGFTATEPAARVASLQTGSPERLRLVAAVPGSLELERALHELLRGSRIHGEWFGNTEEVKALLVGVAISRPMTAEELASIPSPLVVTSAELQEIANEIVSRRSYDQAYVEVHCAIGAGVDMFDDYDDPKYWDAHGDADGPEQDLEEAS